MHSTYLLFIKFDYPINELLITEILKLHLEEKEKYKTRNCSHWFKKKRGNTIFYINMSMCNVKTIGIYHAWFLR